MENAPYYRERYIECIDVIEDFSLNFHLGNVVKYVLRAGRKTASVKEDLNKALWYLQRQIDNIDD